MAVRLTRFAPTVLGLAGLLFGTAGCAELADHAVAVSSSAASEYSKAKFGAGTPRPESYVVMQGNYFAGPTVDSTLDHLSFRELTGMLAPELARQRYLPAKDYASADLLIVVHWGVTAPHVTSDEMRAHDTTTMDNSAVLAATHTKDDTLEVTVPLGSNQEIADFYSGMTSSENLAVGFEQTERFTDSFGADFDRATVSRLLGYGRHLRREGDRPFVSTAEATLRNDLNSERYFVILRAYDLHRITRRRPPVVWTLYLNMRSPGNNFKEAVARMGEVAANYVGRDLDRVDTALPNEKRAIVTVGDIIIVGEKK